MLFVGTSIIHPSTEGVFLLCNILDLLIYSLLLNLGFPKDWIEKMLPYINEDTTSWQLRMISLFDQDPEDLVAMLEDSVKNSSVEIFQSIRKKYYIENYK